MSLCHKALGIILPKWVSHFIFHEPIDFMPVYPILHDILILNAQKHNDRSYPILIGLNCMKGIFRLNYVTPDYTFVKIKKWFEVLATELQSELNTVDRIRSFLVCEKENNLSIVLIKDIRGKCPWGYYIWSQNNKGYQASSKCQLISI